VSESGDQPIYSIGAVARMLGVPTSTLRAWEDRYAIVRPNRSEGAQRLYSRVQVEKLRFIKEQIDAGASAADAHRLLAQVVSVASAPAGAPAEDLPARPALPLILIAERDEYAAELAEYFLRTEGWDVATALNATQAQLQFEERSPDVVMLDLLLSGGAGFRLLTEFSARKLAPILALSAIDSSEEAFRAGAAAFMRKPVEPLALVSTIRDLAGTSALVRSEKKRLVER